jgi:hypothetical protein
MRGVLGRCRCRCNVVLRTFFAPPPLWAVGIVCLMWVCNLLLQRQRAAARVAAALEKEKELIRHQKEQFEEKARRAEEKKANFGASPPLLN